MKTRLLGHFGTTPGQNFIYCHLNKLICERDLDIIYISGPGHGGPALGEITSCGPFQSSTSYIDMISANVFLRLTGCQYLKYIWKVLTLMYTLL